MEYIGRLAFPLFALFLVRNYLYYSKSFKRYSLRLLIFALISQPIVMYVFKYNLYELNIFFSLWCGLVLFYSIENKDYILSLLIAFVSLYVEYSIFGLILMYGIYLGFRSTCKQSLIISYILILSTLIVITLPNYTLISPILFLMIISFICNPNIDIKIKYIPGMKYVFYIFYPTHLILLEMIK